MENNKRHRIISLEDLKLKFVEKRRKKYLEDLEYFAESNNLEYLYYSSELKINSKDLFENDKSNKLKDLSKNNINEILVFSEFITCLDSLISEEVSLIANSLFFVRPEGPRVLIYIKNHLATVYNKEGQIKSRFQIKLKGPTILDSVQYSNNFIDQNNNSNKNNNEKSLELYYILDVLLLNGSVLATSELECRLFFLDSIFDEINCLPNIFFKFVKYHEVNINELETVYYRIKSKEFEYETDSLIFVNKTSTYVGGYNPNWLCYKDNNLSKYCMTENVTSKVYLNDYKLYTFDNILIGEVQEKYKHNIIKILVNDIDDYKINYKVIGQSKGNKIPDSLRKIYVNFINHIDQKENNFNKLLNYLNKYNN